MHGVHGTRCEPATRAELHTADLSEGNRPNGWHYSAQVHSNWAAAETEYLWGSHDFAVAVPRCKVRSVFRLI